MAIIYEESGRVFTLQTNTSSYQMKAGEHDVLLHLYYGEKIEPYDMSYLIMRADRGFSGNLYEARKDRTFSLDYLPQEYSCFGNGDYRADCLRAVNADGSQCADLRYKGYKVYKGKYSLPGLPALHEGDGGWETLEIALEDSASGLEVTLYYGVLESLDVIARAARIVNHGQKPVRLERALSFCLDMPDSSMDFMHFYGKHTMERMPERLPLHHGSQSVGSRRGTSSHHHNPFVILCRPEACEEQGECFSFSLLYSGSFTADSAAGVSTTPESGSMRIFFTPVYSTSSLPSRRVVEQEAASSTAQRGRTMFRMRCGLIFSVFWFWDASA